MPQVSTIHQDGAAIRVRRLRMGLSLSQLGERIGRHPQALRHIERETRSPSELMLNQIARALDADPADFIKVPPQRPRRRDSRGSAA